MRRFFVALLLALAPGAAPGAGSEPIAAVADLYDEAGVRHAVLIELYELPCALSARELPEGMVVPREMLHAALWTAWPIARAGEPVRVPGCWVRWQMHVIVFWADRSMTPIPVASWDTPARAHERLERLRTGRGGAI